jgi:DNA-binding transcriptional LysR family regulator
MGRRLRALEEALGHTLFQRTSDGFVLTDDGAEVLSYMPREWRRKRLASRAR